MQAAELRSARDQDEAECLRLWREELSQTERLRLIDWSNALPVELTEGELLATRWLARAMLTRLQTLEA